jgi:hypothetical protein
MDKLIFINRNWPSNPWIGCLKLSNIASTCELEFDLMVKREAKFEKQVDDENSLDLHDSFKSQISPILRWFVSVMC